jgi:hypothetical protein
MIDGFKFSYDDVDGQNEALDSDVWRFQSILGYCLISVFALVQSMPVTSTEEDVQKHTTPPLITPGESFNAKIDAKDHEINALKISLISIKRQNKKLIATTEDQKSEAVKLLKDAKKSQQEKIKSENEAFSLKQQLIKEKNERAKYKQKKAIKQKPVLTIRFLSDDALLTLLTESKIQIFAQTKTRYWKILRHSLSAIKALPNLGLIGLEQETVPLLLKQQLAGTTTQWFISLNESLQKALQKHLTRHQDGLILINSQGEVSYKKN